MADQNTPEQTPDQTQDQTPVVTEFIGKTPAELVAIITSVQNEKATLASTVADQAATITAQQGTISELTKAAEASAAEVALSDTLLAGQKNTIDELTAQLEAAQQNPSTVPTFTLKGKTYEVHAGVFKYRAPGDQQREYTVAQLLKDKKLQEALVKAGVGFIVDKATIAPVASEPAA